MDRSILQLTAPADRWNGDRVLGVHSVCLQKAAEIMRKNRQRRNGVDIVQSTARCDQESECFGGFEGKASGLDDLLADMSKRCYAADYIPPMYTSHTN